MDDVFTLAKKVSTARVVGVGESTHGTHEFFINRIVIFKLLITHYNFTVVALEDSAETVQLINSSLNKDNDLKNLVSKLYPVWNVQETLDFLYWLRDFNKSGGSVDLVGIDVDQSRIDSSSRDFVMAQNIVGLSQDKKILIWAHNEHLRLSANDGSLENPMGQFIFDNLGEEYTAVAQYMGSGKFSATTISLSDPESDNRELSEQYIEGPLKNSLESILDKKGSRIFNAETYNVPFLVRSFGWGLVPSMINEYSHISVPSNEFKFIIYEKESSSTKIIQS